MITINIHRNGAGLDQPIAVEAISDVLHDAGELLWVDVQDPSPADLARIAEEFAFHPLAVEDAHRAHQRPKIDIYDDFIFLVFYTLPIRDPLPEGDLAPAEIDLFVGRNYVVTVHYGEMPVLSEVRDRWRRNTHIVSDHPAAMLVYSILDTIVDDYFPFVDDLADQIEELEERVLHQADQQTLHELFRFRKELIGIRRVLGPERDLLNVLVRRDTPIFDQATIVYFQDVYDHILRVTDAIDTYRDLISSALDAYLSAASNRLNQVMKTLTAASIVLMTVTLVASIYGMNFVHMPELGWRYGYLWALGLMAALAAVLLGVFRRKDYF